MKEFNLDELAAADGKEGKPALVAVGGKVYDVSVSKRWTRGSHMNRHHAGKDLSDDIKAAPHGPEMLERFEMVGLLRQQEAERPAGLKGTVDAWLEKHPFFRRHPHPAVVHLPVGMLTVAPLFEAIALVTSSPRMDWAALCCFFMGFISIPPAMATGYFTWWMNYDAVDSPIVKAKRRLAWTALVIGTVGMAVRILAVTDPLRLDQPGTIVYVIALLVTSGLACCVGFLGGKLTFPFE